jgi:hypothetical protein
MFKPAGTIADLAGARKSVHTPGGGIAIQTEVDVHYDVTDEEILSVGRNAANFLDNILKRNIQNTGFDCSYLGTGQHFLCF